MCISFWVLDKHPAFWLILALNRDEFHARPTRAAHFWEGEDEKYQILAGKDVKGGGTWLGVTKSGRLAFLTNVRFMNVFEKSDVTNLRHLKVSEKSDAISRGDLPTRFLKSTKSPAEFLGEIALEVEHYNGFNLVVADVSKGEMAFLSNRHGVTPMSYSGVKIVSPGLHSLSNGSLDACWPKMERGKQILDSIVDSLSDADDLPDKQILEKLLRDGTKAADLSAQQAETFCSDEIEKWLSSIFVDTDQAYGTRSMSVVGIRRDGNVSFCESYLEDGEWKDHSFQFQLEPQQDNHYVKKRCDDSILSN